MKKVTYGIILLGFVFGILFGISSWRSHNVQPVEQAPISKINDTTLELSNEALKNISLAKVATEDYPDRLNLMGRITVAEDRMTVVPARVSGRIDTVYLASGESVARGQPLLRLFSPDYVAAQEEYLQSLHKMQGEGDGGSEDFTNLSALAKKKLETMGLSDEDITALSQGKTSKEDTLLIRAPRAGVIIDKKAVVGNLMNVGDTLFTIADISKVWFLGDLYPEDIPKVHKDQEIIISAEGERVRGKVSFISPVVDPTAHTIKIRALIDNSKMILKADLYVQGSLILSNKRALVIPSQALIRLQDAYSVFKKVGNNQFQKVVVEISGEQDGVAAISKGLSDGDSVVSDGALLLDAALETTGK